VLDGATNALDNLTERAVMDAVHNLGHQMTIILITHRLTTMRECDRIFLLNRGKLVGEGTLDHLIRQDAAFRTMALAVEDPTIDSKDASFRTVESS